MKIKSIVLFLLLSAFSANAQESGYLGERFVIGYSNYFFPGFRGPGPNAADPAGQSSFCLNNVNCLNVEYAYAERRMLCLSTQYLRTGIAYDNGIHDGVFDAASSRDYPYPGGSKYGGDFSKPALLSSLNFGLGIKMFKRGFIAPVGRYKKIEFLFLLETVKYDNTNFRIVDPNNSDETIAYTAGNGIYKYKNVAISYTIGNQRVLFDKLILDYGLRFAYTPGVNIISYVAETESVGDMSGVYRFASRTRIFREQLINIHIGLGFLAF